LNIGFISTRLAGTDGVSLETAKWVTVLRRMGHKIYYCAGELEAGGPPGKCVPEMHFRDPRAKALGARAFGGSKPDPTLLDDIARLAEPLLAGMREFVDTFGIEALIIQNGLAIPMQLPLGLALAELITETGLPTIAHHHDFYWERERFRTNCIPEFLDTYFPFDAPQMRHVVINSPAQGDLKARRGIEATIVPNVFDFGTPPSRSAIQAPPSPDAFNYSLRDTLGLTNDHLMILQPTRVVPRKGIETSIELIRRLREPHNLRRLGKEPVLVITHHAGDEGMSYLHQLQQQAQNAHVPLIYAAAHFEPRRAWVRGRKVYSLWDAYIHADFVTYPSLYEGFGNALLETICFRQPAMVNRYSVYVVDIAPLGFDLIEIDGTIVEDTVEEVIDAITNPARRREMVAKNFRLGAQHFSYEVLQEKLQELLAQPSRHHPRPSLFREHPAQRGSSDPRLERQVCHMTPVLSAPKRRDLELRTEEAGS